MLKRLLILLALLVPLCVNAQVAPARHADIVLNTQGKPVPGAIVTVFLGGTMTPATLYSDFAGTILANPTTADVLGNYVFYVEPGVYDIQISGIGITTTTFFNTEISSNLMYRYRGLTAQPSACAAGYSFYNITLGQLVLCGGVGLNTSGTVTAGSVSLTSATATFIQLGSGTFPSSGYIRLGSSTYGNGVVSRNSANSADVELFALRTLTGPIINVLDIGTGLPQVNLGATVITSNPIALSGPNPAQSGDLRLRNASAIMSRNAANSADRELIKLSAADIVTLGQSGTVTSPAGDFNVPFGQFITWNGQRPLVRATNDFTARTSHTGTTSETTLRTIALTANEMGAVGCFDVLASGQITNGGTPGQKDVRIKFDGTTIVQVTRTASNAQQWHAEITICNRGVTNSQFTSFFNSLTDSINLGNGNGALSVDTTVSKSITVTGQLANSGDTIHVDLVVLVKKWQ